jgi:hypothetical protein
MKRRVNGLCVHVHGIVRMGDALLSKWELQRLDGGSSVSVSLSVWRSNSRKASYSSHGDF